MPNRSLAGCITNTPSRLPALNRVFADHSGRQAAARAAMASSRSSASLKSREGMRGIVLTVHVGGQALTQLMASDHDRRHARSLLLNCDEPDDYVHKCNRLMVG